MWLHLANRRSKGPSSEALLTLPTSFPVGLFHWALPTSFPKGLFIMPFFCYLPPFAKGLLIRRSICIGPLMKSLIVSLG